MKKKILLLSIAIIVLSISACSPSNKSISPEVEEPVLTNANQAYPSVPTIDLNNVYPVEPKPVVNNGYPSPSNSTKPQGPIFEINKPVLNGSTKVTGIGPVNVPIILIDVTEMGLMLSETTIDNSGNFQFNLDSPLSTGHSVGVQIGDLSNTDFNYDDFIYSDKYIDRPMIGIILAIASVVDQ